MRRIKETRNRVEQFGCENLLSREMQEYLRERLSENQALDIIAGAPVSLQDKLDRLSKLAESATDSWCMQRIESIRQHIKQALEELENCEYIQGEACWFDLEDGDRLECINSSNLPPCSTLNEFREAILDEIEENTEVREYLADYATWYEFEVWKRNADSGKRSFSCGAYRYILIGPNICYIKPSHHLKMGVAERKELYTWETINGSINLNLPIPFEAGDMVTVDCRPFAPVQNMLIVGVGDNNDCCAVRGAFADEDGGVTVTSVKHSHCFPRNYISRLSPLYRMTICKERYNDNEEILHRLCSDMKRLEAKDRPVLGRILEEWYGQGTV